MELRHLNFIQRPQNMQFDADVVIYRAKNKIEIRYSL